MQPINPTDRPVVACVTSRMITRMKMAVCILNRRGSRMDSLGAGYCLGRVAELSEDGRARILRKKR